MWGLAEVGGWGWEDTIVSIDWCPGITQRACVYTCACMHTQPHTHTHTLLPAQARMEGTEGTTGFLC